VIEWKLGTAYKRAARQPQLSTNKYLLHLHLTVERGKPTNHGRHSNDR